MKKLSFVAVLAMIMLYAGSAQAQSNEVQITNANDLAQEFFTTSEPTQILDQSGTPTGFYLIETACYKKRAWLNKCRRRTGMCIRPVSLVVDADMNIISATVIATGQSVELYEGVDAEGNYVRSTDEY